MTSPGPSRERQARRPPPAGPVSPPAPSPATMTARNRETVAPEVGAPGCSAAHNPGTNLLQGHVHGGARWRPGGPGCYFRLPFPAAVSTLAALTSPRPRLAGRSSQAAPLGGEYAGAREAGRSGAGPLTWAGTSGLPYLDVTPASPNVPKREGEDGRWNRPKLFSETCRRRQGENIIITNYYSCSKSLELLVTHLYFQA